MVLACAKASSVPKVMYGSARAAWYTKLSCVLACSSEKAVACSFSGKRGSPRALDVLPPIHVVMADVKQ